MKNINMIKVSAIVLMMLSTFFSCSKKGESTFGCDSEGELYYCYYLHEKVLLHEHVVNDWLLIAFEREAPIDEIVKYINQTGLFKPVDVDQHYFRYRACANDELEEYFGSYVRVNTKTNKTCAQLKEIMRKLEESPMVTYVGHGYIFNDNYPSDMWLNANIFVVEVKDENDLSDLYAVAQETNSFVMGAFTVSPKWFYVRIDKYSTIGNSTAMANYFQETGNFVVVDYGFFSILPVAGSVIDQISTP